VGGALFAVEKFARCAARDRHPCRNFSYCIAEQGFGGIDRCPRRCDQTGAGIGARGGRHGYSGRAGTMNLTGRPAPLQLSFAIAKPVTVAAGKLRRAARERLSVRFLRRWYRATYAAYDRLGTNDGWAIASHIALSVLMAMFPFMILLTAIAGFFGTKDLADEVADLMLDTWPKEVSEPISNEVHKVLTTSRSDLLTIGVALAVFFASSGIESLRIGLNRAYGVIETRNWMLLRLESIAYVIVGAIAMLALSFLIVLAPLIFATALKYAPWLDAVEETFTFWRYGIAGAVLIISLVIVHKWLPGGHRTLREIAPGIIATLFLWMLCGVTFGRYLADFAYTYVTYYAGLASAMIALVFLYFTSLIFVYGGELNHALRKLSEPDEADDVASQGSQPPESRSPAE
jgi:membrane protein